MNIKIILLQNYKNKTALHACTFTERTQKKKKDIVLPNHKLIMSVVTWHERFANTNLPSCPSASLPACFWQEPPQQPGLEVENTQRYGPLTFFSLSLSADTHITWTWKRKEQTGELKKVQKKVSNDKLKLCRCKHVVERFNGCIKFQHRVPTKESVMDSVSFFSPHFSYIYLVLWRCIFHPNVPVVPPTMLLIFN